MRIAFVIGTANPGGAEGQLTRLAAGLVARGHEVVVYFLVEGGPLTRVLDAGGVPWVVHPVISPSVSKAGKVRALLALARQLRRSRPEVVYAWLPGVIWLALPLAHLVTGARTVAAFRGLVQTFEVRTPLRRAIFRQALRRADAVTANAPWLEEEAIRWGAAPGAVHFMPNGVTMPSGSASPDRQPPRAVVVANFFAYKRHELVVRAMAEVPGFEATFIGSGELLEPTRALAEDLGVAERLRIVPDCDDVSPHLLQCQLAIHPSSTEGMSNAVLEELAHGLPVVATDVGATSLIVEDGVNGYVVPVDDAVAMADRVAALVGSPELRANLGRAARESVQRFSWSANVERNETLFAQLLERTAAPDQVRRSGGDAVG